jgi:hypothetical protein
VKKIKLTMCIFLSVHILSACSLLQSPRELNVIFDTDTRLLYKGNSAAMMSMIGPEGIAIGMAIDEGIAKELEANLAPQGGSKVLLTHCFIAESKQTQNENLSELSIHTVDIVPQEDGYYAVLAGTIIHRGQKQEFTTGKRDWGMTSNLSDLKRDPAVTAQLLTKACRGTWREFVASRVN